MFLSLSAVLIFSSKGHRPSCFQQLCFAVYVTDKAIYSKSCKLEIRVIVWIDYPNRTEKRSGKYTAEFLFRFLFR